MDWSHGAGRVETSAAIIDRLTYNATIIESETDSYRLACTRAQQTGVTG
ncbi:hypothetical protein GCM10009850_111360 [Nonomuraea monospora]|uniref:IstB-like ATP-binding protein domain-containing protein n=1 Tax=Nonomuraea monospora TaxID=568818 RepID=A0ABN3D207_9ACTN